MVSALAFIAKKVIVLLAIEIEIIYAYLSIMCMSIILGCNVGVSCPCPYVSALTALHSHWKLNFGIGKFAKFKFLLS